MANGCLEPKRSGLFSCDATRPEPRRGDIATRVTLQGIRTRPWRAMFPQGPLRAQQGLRRATLVHGRVGLRSFREGQLEIEHAAGTDRARADVGQQFLDV